MTTIPFIFSFRMAVSFFLKANSLCPVSCNLCSEETKSERVEEWLEMVFSQLFVVLTITESISLKVDRIILHMSPDSIISGQLPAIAGQ